MATEATTRSQDEAHLPVLMERVSAAAVSTESKSPRLRRYRAQMRGRWRWVVLLGLVGLIAGGLIGYFTTQPMYRSRGLVEVRPITPGATDSAADALVERHVTLLHGLNNSDRGRVEVQRSTRSDTQIRLTSTDADPTVPAAALRTLLDAYQQSPEVTLQNAQAAQLAASLREQARLTRELAEVERRIAEVTHEPGSPPLGDAYTAKAAQLADVQQQLSATRDGLAKLEEQAVDNQRLDSFPTPSWMKRADAIDLRLRKQQLERELDVLYMRMGKNAPAVIERRTELRALQRQLAELADETPTPMTAIALAGADGEPVMLTLDQLRTRERRLAGLEKTHEEQLMRLADRQALLGELRAEVDALRLEREAARAQTERIGAGAPALGRVDVTFDDRARVLRGLRLGRTCLGGLLGLLLGAGLVMLYGGIDQRMRRPDRVMLDEAAAPLFGTVPTIAPDAGLRSRGLRPRGDALDADRTALSIHEIRGLLELHAQRDGSQAFAITSPSRGSGKTSLTVGLASSLAMSGIRTLLVDCELAGRIHEPINPRPTDDDDKPGGRQSLDQVMIDMGYLNEGDTDRFLLADNDSAGLVGALNGTPLSKCVLRTRVKHLSMLPSLSARAEHIGRLSGRFIQRLIAEARGDYDMVLFDTGPIPGSVEAMFVAGAADGVVLVVSRGELQGRFDRTISQLRMIGAKLVGTVFNRTDGRDLTIQLPSRPEGASEAPAARRRPATPTRYAGSGIFAAAVDAQAHATDPSDAADVEVDDDAITAADAGVTLDDLDAEIETESPAPDDEPRPALQDVLDHYVDATIESADKAGPRSAKIVDDALDDFLEHASPSGQKQTNPNDPA